MIGTFQQRQCIDIILYTHTVEWCTCAVW